MKNNKLIKYIEKNRKLIQYIKEIKYIILIAILIILFKEVLENTLNVLLIDPILSKIEINFFTDLIFIGLGVLIVILLIFRLSINYYASNLLLTSNIFISAFYLYYRFDTYNCELFGLSIYESIKYLDIILLILFSLVLIKICHRKSINIVDTKKGFFLDTSLGKKGDDLLNREHLAKHIAKEIINTSSPDSSFAIGISSEWGFGKTSFFDLLERNISLESNIIIKINPWINHDSRNIIKDFFGTLSSELSVYNSSISPVIKKYAEVLIGIGNGRIKEFLSPIIKHYQKNETVLGEFQEIDSAIKKINKKIIIFIDDLDRLYKEEIIQVVKLIRNSANFGNVVFVVAYDRDYIINAIKGINNYNPELFLEKIFQLEIRLPNFETQIIQKRIFELLSSRVTEEDKKELITILLKKKGAFDTNVFNSGALTSLRDATRFSNSFLIAYSYLKGEVVLSDLLNLEVLRLKYPSVYKLIFFHSNEYLETERTTNNKTFYTLNKKKIKDKENQEIDILTIRDYLENIIDKTGMSQNDIDKSINILYSLFPSTENIFFRHEIDLLSVANPSSFDRYSHYRLLDTNLSELEFSKFRAKPIDEFCKKIKEWVFKGLRWELKRRFEEIEDYSDKSDFEKIIKAIFYFARIPKVEKIESDYSGFDYDNLYSKLTLSDKYVELGYFESKEKYVDFLSNIFEESTSPYSFDIEFIFSTLDKFTHSKDFPVPSEKLEEIRLNYFKEYLLEATQVDGYVWHLYHYNDTINKIEHSNNSYSTERIKNKEATKLLVEFVKEKALDSFLNEIIGVSPFNVKIFNIGKIIPQMFGGYDKFEEFLLSCDESKFTKLKEFKVFFYKLKEAGFDKYIEFKFKSLNVKVR